MPLLFLIRSYQVIFPFVRLLFGVQGACKYPISCSEYASIALKEFGALEGTKLAFYRLMSCHSFNKASD